MRLQWEHLKHFIGVGQPLYIILALLNSGWIASS